MNYRNKRVFKNWNYRVIKHENYPAEPYYQIHEVYYNEKGKPASVSTEPVEPHGSDLKELKECLRCMTMALKQKSIPYTRFERSK